MKNFKLKLLSLFFLSLLFVFSFSSAITWTLSSTNATFLNQTIINTIWINDSANTYINASYPQNITVGNITADYIFGNLNYVTGLPWTITLGKLHPTNLTSTVGIGTNDPDENFDLEIKNDQGDNNNNTMVAISSGDGNTNASLFFREDSVPRYSLDYIARIADPQFQIYSFFTDEAILKIEDSSGNSFFANNLSIQDNLFAPNICYSNGTNCLSSSGEQIWTNDSSYVFLNENHSSKTIKASSLNLSNLLTVWEISANSIFTNTFKTSLIRGDSLTLQSDNLAETPTATPLYLNTYSENKVTMYPANGYGQSMWTLADDTFITGDGTVYSNLDGDTYWAMEFVDGYSYMAYAPNGLQWYTNNEDTLVLDAYPDGTTEWHENGQYDKNLTVNENINIGDGTIYWNGTALIIGVN